ncbi:MAG: NUDIX hydrolase [Acidimicrobiales bacterium]
MREWLVGGGVVEGPAGLLLVQNRRRNGMVDWSTPGGVIDAGESLMEGLTREVREETGLQVSDWSGPVYEVQAEAPDLGWRLRVEAHLAVDYAGDLVVDDPDGIVVDACFTPPGGCQGRLAGAPRWVREPLTDWLTQRWVAARTYRYRVDGTDLATLGVTRLP